MWKRLWAITHKEALHIIRDRRTLAIIFLMPIVELVLLGYAATTDIEYLPIAVLDWDNTAQSRGLAEAYRASGYFNITRWAENEEQLAVWIEGGQVRAGLVIPAGFGRDLLKTGQAEAAFIIDGSDPAVATTAYQAALGVGQAQSVKLIETRLGMSAESAPGIDVRPRVWYNPEMKSNNFMIPGIIGIVLQFLTTLFTSMAIVREREQNTLEQLLVTPIRSFELILGKIMPYVIVAFLIVLEVLAIGVWWFGVPIRGSVPLLLALCALFLLTALGFGILISAVSKTQQEAMFLTFLTAFPSIFLGGFFFPIEAMPWWLQAISYLIPLRYLLVIIRGIVLKGVGLPAIWEPVLLLGILGPVVLALASVRFAKRLE
jgi:ABC-2 type transport system permease protein